MGLRDTFSDFLHWWTGTLSQIVPSFMRRKEVPLDLKVSVQRNGFFLEPIAGRKFRFEPTLVDDVTQLGDAINVLKRGFRSSKGKFNILLKLADDRFIIRRISPLNLPNSSKINMAAIDIQGATPFKPDDVFIVTNDPMPAQAGSSYAIIKKVFLQPVLEQFSKAQCQVADVVFGENRDFSPSAGSMRSILPSGRMANLPQNLIRLGVAVLIIGALVTLGRIQLRHNEANRTLDIAISEAGAKASSVRQLIAKRNETIAQLTTIRSAKNDITPVVVIMEELSRVIPDDTWITDLEINSGVVQISGFSANAAKLIPELEASPYFMAPTFRSPVLKVNVQVGERFSITMRVERQVEASG